MKIGHLFFKTSFTNPKKISWGDKMGFNNGDFWGGRGYFAGDLTAKN